MSTLRYPEPASAALRLTGLEQIGFLLICAFAVEVILGGPGFWAVGGVSLRKLLFTVNLAYFGLLWVLGRFRLSPSELGVVAALLAVMLVWIVMLPALSGERQITLALQDGLPLATALLGLLVQAFFRRQPSLWPTFCRAMTASLAAVALLNLALWGLGASGEAGNVIAQAIALYWFTWGHPELSPPLYLGMMPDGFFRAMWITGVLYIPALLYCIAQRRTAGILLFSLALLVTYTRSLWLAAFVAIVIAQALSSPRQRFIDLHMTFVAAAVSCLGLIAVLLWSQTGEDRGLLSLLGERAGSAFSDTSADERYEQVAPLVDAWSRSPWFGRGFGAQAALVRSEDAPFSYELTVLALLMKVGVVGLVSLLLLVGGSWLAALLAARPRRRSDCAGLAAIVGFLLAASTNPFLLNFVGMSALCFMSMKLHLDRQCCA